MAAGTKLAPKFASAHQISLKMDDSWLRYSETFLKWRPSAILNFRNFVFWSCDLYLNMIMLLLTEFHVNLAINCRYSQKTIFNMAAVRHIGFVVTSSYFIRVLCIMFLTLC